MANDKNGKLIQMDWHRKDGVWLSPESAAPYFRNGKGLDLEYLYKKLRSGKLDDIAMKDAFGYLIFVPTIWIENFNNNNPLKAA